MQRYVSHDLHLSVQPWAKNTIQQVQAEKRQTMKTRIDAIHCALETIDACKPAPYYGTQNQLEFLLFVALFFRL